MRYQTLVHLHMYLLINKGHRGGVRYQTLVHLHMYLLMNKGHRGACEVSNTCSSTYVLIDE